MGIRVLLVLVIAIVKAEAQTSASSIGDSLFALGNYNKAINAYAQVGNPAAELQIARAYNAIGNYQKAVLQYESIIVREPNLKIAIFELGKLHLKLNAPESAVSLFFDLTLDSTGNPEYYYYLGRAFQDVGSISQSIRSYKNAIALESTHLRSLFQLSKYYLVKQEKDSVLTYTNQGLDFYPDDVSLINLKALAYYNNDEFPKSIPFFERLLELGEQKLYIYLKLGYAYFKTWELEKSKEMYKIAIAMDAENANAFYELGHVFLKDRLLDSAAFYIKKSIEIQKPFLMEEYQSLAGIARQQKKLPTALRYYQIAHEENPEEPQIFFQICTLYDQMTEAPDKKLRYYERFIEKYGKEQAYLSEMVQRRITELNEQIHFAKD